MEHFEDGGAEEIINKMKAFEASDRFGALCEISYQRVEKFVGEQWGRQPRRTGS